MEVLIVVFVVVVLCIFFCVCVCVCVCVLLLLFLGGCVGFFVGFFLVTLRGPLQEIRQMLMRAIAHGGCTVTVRESALEVDWQKSPLPHRVLEPASALHLASITVAVLQPDIVPTELPPTSVAVTGAWAFAVFCRLFAYAAILRISFLFA